MMEVTRTDIETELLQLFRMLPEDKQREVFDFISFLHSKVRNRKEQPEQTHAASVVEETWGSIPLDRETSRYIAEDKELEYQG